MYFKTYDKNLSFKSLEMQLKGSKKEKIRFNQFMVHEEKEYWKGFPRKIEFYHSHLRTINDIASERLPPS
jgi:hypothetical protein